MSQTSRRKFLLASATGAAMLNTPAIPRRRDAKISDETIIGEGEHRFRVNHQICQLPDKYHWQMTHNVAVDSANNFYVIHEGKKELKDHPSIFVFDSTGKFIRAFGSQFQGGGHGVEIRKEGNEEFLYVAAYQGVKAFAKMTLSGGIVWYKKAPMESGVYRDGQDTSTTASWERKGFLPTNFAFLDDGGFLLADGYGSYYIHQFDKDANWVKCFGGAGKDEGKFSVAHGLCIDQRPGREIPSILVTDRAHNTVQRFTMDGEYTETISDLRLPCNFDTWKNVLLVSEYGQRLTLLDEKNEVIAHLGDGMESYKKIGNMPTRTDQWIDGEFMRTHDACFDSGGNIYATERVPTGRVTKLTRIV